MGRLPVPRRSDGLDAPRAAHHPSASRTPSPLCGLSPDSDGRRTRVPQGPASVVVAAVLRWVLPTPWCRACGVRGVRCALRGPSPIGLSVWACFAPRPSAPLASECARLEGRLKQTAGYLRHRFGARNWYVVSYIPGLVNLLDKRGRSGHSYVQQCNAARVSTCTRHAHSNVRSGLA